MKEVPKSERTLGIYLVILYFVVELIYLIFSLAPNIEAYSLYQSILIDFLALPIVIGIFAVISIIGLWLMKKWGAALTAVLSGLSLSRHIDRVIVNYTLIEYYPDLPSHLVPKYLISSAESLIGLVLDVVVAIFIFKWIFSDRFKEKIHLHTE